jgi:FAD/FMN-containing dehydrogenase
MESHLVSVRAIADAVRSHFSSSFAGSYYLPDHPEYDQARKAFNLTVDQHPALILVPATPSDVVEAVNFARQQRLGIAVQSTGHGVVHPADGGLLILTHQLADVRVNAAAMTAWVGAGARWGSVLEKTREHGLAPLLGSSPGVGVVGYTLGGGMGWLARKYGMALDSVNAFELVTPEGSLLMASHTENADLFWALRGGGGNFGVVTGMEIRLYPVTTVYGGNLIYPASDAHEVMARYSQWVTSLPDEMTTSIALMNMPPIPAVPEPLRGKSVIMVRGCYCGPLEQGEALLQPWREWKSPLIDAFGAMPFSQVATISSDPLDPVPVVNNGAWLNDLSPAMPS